jgi:hypothetical protein
MIFSRHQSTAKNLELLYTMAERGATAIADVTEHNIINGTWGSISACALSQMDRDYFGMNCYPTTYSHKKKGLISRVTDLVKRLRIQFRVTTLPNGFDPKECDAQHGNGCHGGGVLISEVTVGPMPMDERTDTRAERLKRNTAYVESGKKAAAPSSKRTRQPRVWY